MMSWMHLMQIFVYIFFLPYHSIIEEKTNKTLHDYHDKHNFECIFS